MKTRKATGPRTAAGKPRSRRNAIKHGIFCEQFLLDGENAAEYAKLHSDLMNQWRPIDVTDVLEVEHLASLYWRRRRVHIAETAIISRSPDFAGTRDDSNSDLPHPDVLRRGGKDGSTLRGARVARLEFALEALLKLLQRLAKPELEFLEAVMTVQSIYGNVLDDTASIPCKQIVTLLMKRCAAEAQEGKSTEAVDFATETSELIFAEADRFRQLLDVERSKDIRNASLASLIPSQQDLERIIGYESHLSREIDRTENRLERRQRERRADRSATIHADS